MSISPSFVSRVFKMITEEMAEIGFLKRKPGIFTLRLNDEVLGWVGLNTAHYVGGILEINPTIGVRHQELETLVHNLMGLKQHPYIPATVGTPIGYLTPKKQFTAWSFQEGTDCDAIVTEMVEAIEKFGKPFMERNANLLAIYETMRSPGLATSAQLEYCIPAACALLGKNADAEEFLNKKLQEQRDRNDIAADWFRRFAAGLGEVLENKNGDGGIKTGTESF